MKLSLLRCSLWHACMNRGSCVQQSTLKIDKGIAIGIKDLAQSPPNKSCSIYPQDVREGLTEMNTNEITTWGSLYVVCTCLGERRLHRTATLCID